MSVSKRVKMVMLDKGIKVQDVAHELGIDAQTMSNRLFRDKWTTSKLEEVLDAMGCELVIKDSKTGKLY